jgi:Carboxypeptidase regulatory-like domain
MMSTDRFCHRRLVIGVVLFICLSTVFVPSFMAQTASTGALTGTIKDPSGAVIPNATVTATSVDSGAARTATTGADGAYRFTLLPPGNYRVRIEASGFKPVEIPTATVNVTETEVLDRNLEIGGQTQTVTVEGEVVAIQTTSSTLGTVANARTLTELPLNTRNYTNLLAMSGGVSADVNNATLLGKGATRMAVNGGATGQNAYLMDGVAVNNWAGFGGTTEGGTVGSFAMPNPDAIAEFKIQTSTYDAGSGRNPGANVNVVTKSGTNNFHGSAFEFFRNSALNANDWFLNREGVTKPALNSNQYGGAVGGPVKKDKLFFFISYQETDQKNGFSAFSDSATILPPLPAGNRGTCNGGKAGWYSISACDAAGQAFIQNLAALSSSSVPKQGTVPIQNPTACAAASNCDSQGLFNINPIAISLLQAQLPDGSYYIPGSGTSRYAPQNFVIPATFKDHQAIGNIDYVINSKHTLSGRWVYDADPYTAAFGVKNAQEPVNLLPGVPVSSIQVDQDAVLRLTSILSNNLVNDFHIGYQRYTINTSRSSPFTNSQFGIQDFVSPFAPGGLYDNLSNITVNGSANSGLFDLGVFGPFDARVSDNQYVIGDQISWTHGKHSLRLGVEDQKVILASISRSSSGGAPTFQSFADLLIGRAGCGTGLSSSPTVANPGGCNGTAASNMTAQGTTSANGSSQTNPRDYFLSAFIQDDLKVSARLTLNVGLRWELDQFPWEANGNFSNFSPALASLASAPLVTTPGGAGQNLAGYVVPSNYTGVIPAGVYQSAVPYDVQHGAPWDNFAPRIGFAWQPLSTNKFVLRGGAGYFYDLLSGGATARLASAGPLHGPPSSGSPAASLYDPWAIPPGVVSAGAGNFGFVPRWVDQSTVSLNPLAPCLKPPCSSNTNPFSLDPNWTVPLTYEWNLNTQYEFLPSWVLEVGYVGSHGIHQVSPGAVSGPTADGTSIANPWNIAQLAGVGAPCVSCAATGVTSNSNGNAILRVPNLGINANATQLQTNSNYKYNALQVTLRKQFSKGFQLQGAYTWARAFEQAPQGINTYPYVIQTYSPEYLVRSQRLVINYVWELPLGHQKGWMGKVTDGWSWSGVTTIQNGQPQDIVDSSGGRIFGVTGGLAGTIGHAQLCPGMTYANIATSGSTQQRITNGLQGGDGWINSAAFCAPPSNIGAVNGSGGGTGFGDMGVGNVLGPGQYDWDMSLAKIIKIRETRTLEFRTEFYNTFNHPQFANVLDTDANDRATNGGGLGNITVTSVNPRVLQFGLKFLF